MTMNERIIKIINQIKELLKDNHGECDIPDHILVELARCLLPDIIAFYESKEGKKIFEEWKAKQSTMQSNCVSSPNKNEKI